MRIFTRNLRPIGHRIGYRLLRPRPNFGRLEIDVTVEDPKSYTRTWTVRINDRIMLNTELIEFICNENERSDAHLLGK